MLQELRWQGKLKNKVTVRSRNGSSPCFFFNLRVASLRWQPITSVEVKFVARQVEDSVVIRATKLKFVAESRTRVYFFATRRLNLQHRILLRDKLATPAGGNTRNREFQLALQQCCKTSWKKMLPVLPDLYRKNIFLQEALSSSLQKLPFNLRRSILWFGQSYNFTELQTKAKHFDQLVLHGDTTRKPVKYNSII